MFATLEEADAAVERLIAKIKRGERGAALDDYREVVPINQSEARALVAAAAGFKSWSDLELRLGTEDAPAAPDLLTSAALVAPVAKGFDILEHGFELATLLRPQKMEGDCKVWLSNEISLLSMALPEKTRLDLARDLLAFIRSTGDESIDDIELVTRIAVLRGLECDKRVLRRVQSALWERETRVEYLKISSLLEGKTEDDETAEEYGAAASVIARVNLRRDEINAMGLDDLAQLLCVAVDEVARWGGAADSITLFAAFEAARVPPWSPLLGREVE